MCCMLWTIKCPLVIHADSFYNGIYTEKYIYTLPKISLATLDGQNANPKIAVESEMRSTLKVHGEQANVYTI